MRGSTTIIAGLGLVCLYLARERAADPPTTTRTAPAARVATVPRAPWQPDLAPPPPVDSREHRDPRDLREVREDAERGRVDYLRELDARLAHEPVDPSWRPELALETALHAIPGARARETRCTATFCRVVVARADELTANQLAERIGASGDSPYAAGTMFDAGEHETTLYVFRPRQPVPPSERTP